MATRERGTILSILYFCALGGAIATLSLPTTYVRSGRVQYDRYRRPAINILYQYAIFGSMKPFLLGAW